MKKLILVLFTLVLSLGVNFDAEAKKKKFGSKSTGKTHQTTDQNTQQKVDTNNPTLPAKTSPASSSKKGLLGGVLGGLLAGGLIAAMLGGDFEGLQFFDILLFAVIGFILFKVIKSVLKKKQTQYAGVPPQYDGFQQKQQASPFTATANTNVPLNLPRDFDKSQFLMAAKSHYVSLQKAWNDADFAEIETYLAPELVSSFKTERAAITEPVATDVLALESELVRMDHSFVLWEASVRFTGKYRDNHENQEYLIDEVWHLERDSQQQGAWLIVGIEDRMDD